MRQDALQQDTEPPERDAVDAIVEQWHRERPDLDPGAKHVTGRVVRLAGIFQQAYDEAFAPIGLAAGDYGMLVALRRAGPPHRLTPTDLARQRMMTSGGMTAAIDRLERKGLVDRRPNQEDRRGTLVGLTPAGLDVVDEAMARHAEAEQALVAGLDDDERDRLASLLRRLLLSVDAGGA